MFINALIFNSSMVDFPHKLEKLISQISDLETKHHDSVEFSIWNKAILRTLKGIFGDSDERIKQFGSIGFGILDLSNRVSDYEQQEAYLYDLNKSKLLLQDFLTEVPDTKNTSSVKQTTGDDVFIVHGHDNEAKQETARLVEQLDLNAVILHERTNRGRTVIEKLIGESDNAGYAIILLTPDDIGCIKGSDREPEERARQNVVLELGYFLGKLGRERVCVLLKGSASMPSDFNGVLYIQMDNAGKWKFDLAKELKEAGFTIELGKIS